MNKTEITTNIIDTMSKKSKFQSSPDRRAEVGGVFNP